MRLIIDSATFYTAHFSRGLPPRPLMALTREFALCSIHKGPCTHVMAPKREFTCVVPANVGIARCSELDHYTSTGRKLAFTRAIAPLSRETRTLLWRQYMVATKYKAIVPTVAGAANVGTVQRGKAS